MKTRVITAIVAIAAFIPLLFVIPVFFLRVILSIFCAIGTYELLGEAKAVDKKSVFLYFSCVIAFAVAFITGDPEYDRIYLYCAASIYLIGAFILGISNRQRVNSSAICRGFFAVLVVPYMFSSVVRILDIPDYGKYLVLFPWVCVWVCDSAALFVGKAIGKRKLAPTVSPNKTVAGSVGGLIGAVIIAAVYVLFMNIVFDIQLNLLPALIFGAVGSTVGQIGDLAFSMIKREADIKDYGKFFPGHGGVYDRFDSIIFAASFFELFCIYIYSII